MTIYPFHELEIDIEHQDNYDNSEFSNHDEAPENWTRRNFFRNHK